MGYSLCGHKELDTTEQLYFTFTLFIERTDADAGTPILWPPDAKSWFTGKDLDTGEVWGQKKKGEAEDGMVR